MNTDNNLEKIKTLLSKYLVYVFLILIIIILILVFLPRKDNHKNVDSNLTLMLKGNYNLLIVKGDTYIESGYTAYDSKEGDLTSKVVVDGSVDTTTIGSYKLTYRVTNSKGKTAEATRTINVIADLSDVKVEIDYEPKELTNSDVTIDLKVSGDGYDFTLDPDGNISNSNKITYKASSNDEYMFSIKRKDGSVIEKSVEVKNIDKKKPIGSCKNVINDKKTVISVTASDESGIKKYSYNFDGKKYDSTSNSYSVNEIARNVVVTIYDKANNYEMINCINVDNTLPDTNLYVSNYQQLNYILYYSKKLDLNKKNPLVIFLHGSGDIGKNIKKYFDSSNIIVQNMRNQKYENAIFLAPQCNCTRTTGWGPFNKNLKELIDKIVSQYNIDINRISITGHSLGGYGVYEMISDYPKMFSAGVVLAGAFTKNVIIENLADTPIRHYHGTNDTSNASYIRGSRDAEKLKKISNKFNFISIPNYKHDIQKYVYDGTNTIEWMIAQSR